MNTTLSIIIRTMPGREKFLDKSLFILTGQTYQPIELIVVCHKLKETDSGAQLEECIRKWKSHFENIRYFEHVSASDARSRSLNIGLDAVVGRFVAFLDDDDKVYPDHYASLIKPLLQGKAAWAYSDIVLSEFNKDNQLIGRKMPFKREGYSFINHLKGNFIPIHAFVMDYERTKSIGKINESLDKLEDYDYLLRLAFQYEPYYLEELNAEYCVRSDGTNTTTLALSETKSASLAKQNQWNEAERRVNQLKLKQFGWWVGELTSANPGSVSVNRSWSGHTSGSDAQEYLNKIYQTYTWEIIRFGKKINWFIRRRPKKSRAIPNSSQQAYEELMKILFSPAWLLLGPLYWLESLFRYKK